MRAIISIFKEQIINLPKILKLAIYNMKSQYANHYLGVFWNILQPLLQVIVYYIVFGLGLRGSAGSVMGVPFIVHLISGLFPWLFISQGINSGATAIQQNIGLLSKMKFPSSIFISIALTNNMINLLITTLIVFIISLFNHYVPLWHYFWFVYFMIGSFAIIFGISLIMSTLTVIVRDTKNLLQNVIRMLFFMTPIFWVLEEQHGILVKLASLNPFAYLIGVYRTAFIHPQTAVYGTWSDHIYFWVTTLLLITIGAIVHTKFRKRILDYL
ncbi:MULTISPECIES: ABC transporter permease [Staphylococcus]|uniref:Transport permease protein n=3 Tax=Staphylococcus chromogenes TaxID=46126 RepID=A0AAE5SYC1_STACR|nr:MULTISPECIES: ABC transporter permease [Staphylococcus]KDP13597.1 teichoic acid translocation permease [Staphylococcus chromogenes MU 970]MBP0045241.1 ABC transporter permease [Staphylococcus chromogenes]MBV5138598.1 ABC transporter permease [Staphylococcus chromogenes]MBV5191942.1 ABC transporter permease [Staphylococcus chromogenes]MBW3132550.1 ABC transporter permease [Staphylococcus chromogenes]